MSTKRDEKIAYWNALRKKLNLRIFLVYAGVMLLSYLLEKANSNPSNLNIFVGWGWAVNVIGTLFLYLTGVNFMLIVAEFIDRTASFGQQKSIKFVFEVVVNIIFLGAIVCILFL